MDSDDFFKLCGLACIGGVLYYVWKGIEDEVLAFPWMLAGVILASIIFLVLTIWVVIKALRVHKNEKQEAEEQRVKRHARIRKLLSEDFKDCRSDQVMSRLDVIKKQITAEDRDYFEEEIDALTFNARTTVESKRYHEVMAAQKESEKIKQEKIQKERAEQEGKKRKEKHEADVQAVLEFMKKHNSAKAIPIEHNYSEHALIDATWQMHRYLEEQDKRRTTEEKAIQYYQEHDLDAKPHLKHAWQEEIYANVRNRAKNGQLSLQKVTESSIKGKRLNKVFYRARKMTKEEKIRAKLQGYEYVRGNELDGHVSGGFYIRKESGETAYHFCMKHLFAELHPNMQIEYFVLGKRVDVALLIDAYSLGIEIETGKAKIERMMQKIYWLNENFTQWMIVCKKELLPKYSQFVDNKKSFCLTPKDAADFIKETVFYH